MTPDDESGPGDMSVVGVKVNPQMPARLAIYFRPHEARPRTERRSVRLDGGDPYQSVGMV